jgi:hypothetical protein
MTAAPSRNISDRNGDGLLLADQHHEFLASGDAGVDQIPLQHGVVLGHDGNEHRCVFRSLALVDGHRVSGNERVEFAEPVGHGAAVKANEAPPQTDEVYQLAGVV